MDNFNGIGLLYVSIVILTAFNTPVASFTKEVNPWLAERPLVFNGRLTNHGLTSLVKEATGSQHDNVPMTAFLYHFTIMTTLTVALFIPSTCPVGEWYKTCAEQAFLAA